MVETIVVTLCSGLVGAMCVFFVLHPEYEDGIIGRLALSLVGIAAAGRCFGGGEALWTHHEQHVTNVAVLTWIGLAAFLSRHCYRFMKYKSGDRRRRPAK